MGQVPDNAAFSLFDILDAVYGSHASGNLADAFTDSDAAKFDSDYGSKDMNPQLLGGFRNYGACPSVGDAYQGGIVFHILQDGDPGYVAGVCQGLIRTTGIIAGVIYWHATNDGLVAHTSPYIGTGDQNTQWIIFTYGAENNAAKLCSDLSLNGYSDWYLPSADELALLLIGFPDSGYEYWSSSEHSASEAYWYKYNPTSHYHEPIASLKENGGIFYAIRKF